MLTIDTTTHRSPNHSERTSPISAIMIHSCEGRPLGNEERSSIPWLCNPNSGVSCHYYITRSGIIYQLVGDSRVAWHAGAGHIGNGESIGIELEHAKGSGAYPDTQLAALAKICNLLASRYGIEEERIVSHRASALPPGRKIDPTDWPEPQFRAWVDSLFTAPTIPAYTEHSPLLFPCQVAQVKFRNISTQYTDGDVAAILHQYRLQASAVGLDWVLCLAQMLHETGDLTSFWSARPQRNPAGIGVTGQRQDTKPANTDGWKYNDQRGKWERGISFATWSDHAIPAQIGRLLAFAIPIGQETREQQQLIDYALKVRRLPERARGSAPTLRPLGHAHNPALAGWAYPGAQYGAKVASRANRLIGVS